MSDGPKAEKRLSEGGDKVVLTDAGKANRALRRRPKQWPVLGLFILIAIAKWSGNNDADYLITVGAFVGAAYKIIPGIVKIINISGQINIQAGF